MAVMTLRSRYRPRLRRLIPLVLLCSTAAARAAETPVAPPSPEGAAFFEKKVRPLLVKHCYECHSSGAEKVRGKLWLDTRAGVLEGGSSGPAVVPSDPGKSLLIQAVR